MTNMPLLNAAIDNNNRKERKVQIIPQHDRHLGENVDMVQYSIATVAMRKIKREQVTNRTSSLYLSLHYYIYCRLIGRTSLLVYHSNSFLSRTKVTN